MATVKKVYSVPKVGKRYLCLNHRHPASEKSQAAAAAAAVTNHTFSGVVGALARAKWN